MEPIRKKRWKTTVGKRPKYWGTPTFEQQIDREAKGKAKGWGKRKKGKEGGGEETEREKEENKWMHQSGWLSNFLQQWAGKEDPR